MEATKNGAKPRRRLADVMVGGTKEDQVQACAKPVTIPGMEPAPCVLAIGHSQPCSPFTHETSGFAVTEVKGKKAQPDFREQLKAAVAASTPAAVTDQLPPVNNRIRELRPDQLVPNPKNLRKTFVGLEDLGRSLKSGVLIPLVARPKGEVFELVAGERRWRAAKLVGLEVLPVDVRNFTDAQVLEAMITENVQREGLNPLEEAEGMGAMRDDWGFTPAQIAEKLGLREGTVYGRLKLLALCAEARVEVLNSTLPSSAAVPLARIPRHADQVKALKELRRFADDQGKIHARSAIDFLQRNFATTLKQAPFRLADAELLPEQLDAKGQRSEGGSCNGCPFRSKTATPGLFDDLKAAGDTCTNVPCYRAKCEAQWKREAEKAKLEGKKVLSLNEGSELYKYGHLADGTQVELDGKVYQDPKKRTWRELLDRVPEEERPEITVAPDRDHVGHELVDRKPLVEALAKGGLKWAQEEVGSAKKRAAVRSEQREDRQGQKVRDLVVLDVAVRWADSLGDGKVPRLVWATIAESFARDYVEPEVAAALGLEDAGDTFKTIDRMIAKGTERDLRRLALVLAVAHGEAGETYDGYTDELKAIAKLLAVKLPDLEKARIAALEVERAAAKGKKSKS